MVSLRLLHSVYLLTAYSFACLHSENMTRRIVHFEVLREF